MKKKIKTTQTQIISAIKFQINVIQFDTYLQKKVFINNGIKIVTDKNVLFNFNKNAKNLDHYQKLTFG